MSIRFHAPVLSVLLGFSLAACDSANTAITEKGPIEIHNPDDSHDHDHTAEGSGRLVVISATSAEAHVFSLDDNRLVDAFLLTQTPSAIYATAGYRYAALISRTSDYVGFLDGGVWREDHVDHLHDYEEAPALLDYRLTGSRPTHVVNHQGQLAIFYDGDAATSTPASVHVLTDGDIAAKKSALPSIDYSINMHGVAEPRGDVVLVSVRRADADSTSANPSLPDQIGVYHWHDSAYEEHEVFDESCADLHGAAQNQNHIAFGCADGVLLVEDLGNVFSASKIANPAELTNGLRVGTLYGHEHSSQFIGLASAHGGSISQWVAVEPEEGEMHLIDWQPVADARPVSHGFSFDGERFLILDNQGYLTILEPHTHGDHVDWEYSFRVDISAEDPADMPGELRFTMTVAQNANYAYIADPTAQHVLIVDLLDGEVVGDIELDYAPADLVWLGVATTHEH